MFIQKRPGVIGFVLLLYEAQPCQMSLSNSQKPRCKNDSPAESITPWGSPRAQYIVLVPWQALLSTALAGVSFNSLGRRFFQQPWQAFLQQHWQAFLSTALAGVSFNSLVRLAERKICHGRLPLVDAIMSTCLVSVYSAY